jgi:uncharacterized membrane protein YfcA
MDLLVIATFFIGLASSILSGISGGGGGFITMPYFIFIGLSPAQALATAKMGGIGTAFGSIAAIKGKGLVHRKLVVPFMSITIVCAFVSAWLIPQIDAVLFQRIIGVVLILLMPSLFIKKAAFQPGERSKAWVTAGFMFYAVFSFMQTLVGTGMGSILVLILMFLFGLTALEANATKRVAQSSQAIILFVLLTFQGLVVFAHGVAGLIGSLIGSHIGTKFAIKKGNTFVKYVLASTMIISGIILILTA